MKQIITFITLFWVALGNAQDIAYFEDLRNHFYVFEENAIEKQEFLPIVSAQYGNEYVAYIRNNNRLVIYFDRKTHEINATNPRVFAKDNMLAYFVDEQLWVFDNYTHQLLESWVEGNFVIGDDIVAFTNNYDLFKVFYQDSLYTVEQWSVKQAKAGDNLIAYIDNTNQFKIFAYGSSNVIEYNPISTFGASKNIVAYIDNLDNFKVWYDGEIYDLMYQRPSGYRMGEDMVAYMNEMGQYVAFYQGEMYTLLEYKPTYFEVRENVIVYTDVNGFLYAFYKGEIIRLASFTPDKILVDNDIVAYQDLYGYVVGMEFGEKKKFSDQIATTFELFNRTIVYKINNSNWRVYYDDNIYYYN